MMRKRDYLKLGLEFTILAITACWVLWKVGA